MGTPGVKARGDGLLGCGGGPRMPWMDFLANFGLPPLDFNCVKPYKGKMVDWGGGVFCPFGGLMGAPGVTSGGYGLLGRG